MQFRGINLNNNEIDNDVNQFFGQEPWESYQRISRDFTPAAVPTDHSPVFPRQIA